MTAKKWSVHVSIAAKDDLRSIGDWTVERFGSQQAESYATTLALALADLADGPATVGAKSRNELGEGLLVLHVARHRRPGRHLIVFQVDSGKSTVEVLRILHDAMDLARHLPTGSMGEE
jgi:toxin ParE1/3/4